MKYAADDSTAFWAIGHDSGVIAKHAEFCGKEVEMVVPFEGVTSGEVDHEIFYCDYLLVFEFMCCIDIFFLLCITEASYDGALKS